jgi:glucose/arabinose dehydrogenase
VDIRRLAQILFPYKTAAAGSALAALLALTAQVSLAAPAGFVKKEIKTGLDAIAIKVAPDGRIFVTEKKGTIRVIRNDQMLDAPFATVQAKTDNTMEKGLLGIAIDPEYMTNHFVYAYYENKDHQGYVVRWTANGDVAEAGSEKQIFDAGLSGDKDFHHGGDIEFGPDGKLYLTRGNHQNPDYSGNTSVYWGKILRINKDGTIPDDNPWPQNTGIAKANWASGLRNSQSIAFQPGTGRMHFQDIQDGKTDDELNVGKKGGTYGAYSTGDMDPLFHQGSGNGSAQMGGVFYNKIAPGANLSFPKEFEGKYFFGAFGGGKIRMASPPDYKTFEDFDGSESAPINFAVDQQGSLWFVTRTTQVQDTKGKVVKWTYPAGEVPVNLPTGFQQPKTVLDWTSGSKGNLSVTLFRAGSQSLELVSLDGRKVAGLEARGAGSHSLATEGAHGLHFLVWQSGSQQSAMKVVLR